MPSPENDQVDTPISLPSAGTADSPDAGDSIMNHKSLRRCFDLFFTRHFASDFCSFDYRPDFEENYHRKPFLVHSIICLCARYLTAEEAADGFQLPTGGDIWRRHSQIARSKAKAASDEPSVAHIQGYLVLAVAELLAGTGSRHWILQSFSGYPSEIGLAPYFIRTVYLWSNLADFNVCRRRNLDKFPPTDPRSLFFQLTSTLQDWLSSLAPSLQWSIQNYHNHCDLGQGAGFVSMHMLLRSSLCVAHQAYLPQLDGFTVLCERIDAAGWSYLHRENCLIETCVLNAMAIGEMLVTILESNRGGQVAVQSIWVAVSILSAANTFLWVIYAGDEAFSAEDIVNLAKSYLETISRIFTSWQGHWKAAKRWLSTLNAMQAMYRAAYLGDLAQEPVTDVSNSSEEDMSRDFRPEPGNGYPSLVDLPDLHASLHLVSCDSSAMPMDVRTVWLQLSAGWPCDPGGVFDLLPA
ncbi:hypothetical protein ACJZ2D_012748 [Fusarium nematophilum]